MNYNLQKKLFILGKGGIRNRVTIENAMFSKLIKNNLKIRSINEFRIILCWLLY